ncbi:MAG: carboxypeptidase regulatory-like domain-containing protein [Pirellulales bacterium]|nr:carboxypeptidase regulatory-like domain-containing protein [Pirellulales bacterium]
MRGQAIVYRLLVSMALLGVCFPQTILAVETAAEPTPSVTDVALMDGGILIGQVINPEGLVLTEMPVALHNQSGVIAKATTDHNGCFAFRGLRGGVYQLMAARGGGTYRLWAPGSAPPTSQPAALLVTDHNTIRGQWGGMCVPAPCAGCMAFWLSNPWVVAGVLATAVAVPVGIHNSQRPSSP